MIKYTKQPIGILIFLFGIIFFYSFFLKDERLVFFFGNTNIVEAVIFHAIMFLCLVVGYATIYFTYNSRHCVFINKIISINDLFFYISYFLIFVGLIAIFYSATFSLGYDSYLNSLFSLEYSAIRKDFELSSADGGVSGFVKIWGSAPLAVFLTVSSIKYIATTHNLSKKSNYKLSLLFTFAAFSLVIKTAFSLDRITLVAAALVFFVIALKEKKIKYLFAFVIFIIVSDVISRLRLADGGGLNFYFQLYPRLGLENLQLLIDSADGYTYGFNSFLHVISFIATRFGVQIVESVNYNYVWNPAQYLFGFLYLDFGFFSAIPCFMLGIFLGYAQVKSNLGFKYYQTIHFHLLYCIVSFVGVPVFRGLEFWFALSLSLFLMLFITTKRSQIVYQSK